MPCTYDPSAFLFTITKDTVVSTSSCPSDYEYLASASRHTGSQYDWCQYIGYFEAPQTATYTWKITADDYSYTWIGNTALDASYNSAGTQISGYNYNNFFMYTGDYSKVYTKGIDLSGNFIYPIRIQQINRKEGRPSGLTVEYKISPNTNYISNFSNVLVHCPSGNSLINPVTQDPATIIPVSPDASHNHPPNPPILLPSDFPFPLQQKNKRCLGVNQKVDPGLSRSNFNFSRAQFNPGRFRSVTSKIYQPQFNTNS